MVRLLRHEYTNSYTKINLSKLCVQRVLHNFQNKLVHEESQSDLQL